MDDTIFKLMFGAVQTRPGQVQWTTPGTYAWVVPAGVYTISAVCIGAGGPSGTSNSSGAPSGGGGGLRYIKTLAVTPGETLTIVVGVSSTTTANGHTSIYRGATLLLQARGATYNATTSGIGGGGSDIDGNIGGGNGGDGFSRGATQVAYSGGGGAGGYSGNGGCTNNTSPVIPSGGAGGAGARATNTGQGGGGGGVGIYGEGASGTNAVNISDEGIAQGGTGGSGGQDGKPGFISGNTADRARGGLFGGGGGGGSSQPLGGNGACRIIWGAGRAYPSTNTQDL